MTVRLRPLGMDDIAEVREIDRLAFPASDQYDRDFYRHVVGSSDYEALVAVSPNGVIAGWILSHFSTASVRIRSLAVHPNFRRRGVGRALLTAIMERESKEIDLLVEPENQNARKLYCQVGFLRATPDPEVPERVRMLWRSKPPEQ